MSLLFVPFKKAKKEEQVDVKYRDIFSSRPFMLLLANLFFKSLPYLVFLGMSSIIYVEALGVDLASYGYYQGACALVFAIGSLIAGLVVRKFHAKNMLVVSAYLALISFIALGYVTITDSKSPLLIAISFVIFSI